MAQILTNVDWGLVLGHMEATEMTDKEPKNSTSKKVKLKDIRAASEKKDEPVDNEAIQKAYIEELQKMLSDAQEKARENEVFKKRVEEYEAKIGGIRDYVKKMESELQQVKERAGKDVQKAVDRKLSDTLLQLLDSIDNFDRSVQSSKNETGPLVEGIRMVHQQFHGVLNSIGLSRLETSGQEFDPNIHEALSTIPVQSNKEDGKIIEEVKPGYKYHDVLLRPAQVIVGKKSD